MLEKSCFSSVGRVRQHNEDACALPPPGVDEARWGTLLVVADGVGGMAGGAASSRQAVEYLQALYYAGVGADHPADRLFECVEAVNSLNWLSARRAGLARPGLTTLVAAVLAAGEIWIANVGDSRAYLIDAANRRPKQLTEDHSRNVQESKTRAMLGVGGAVHPSSEITRAIGLSDRCQVDTYRYPWLPGDCLVLCSDGLEELPPAQMVEIGLAYPAETAARRLVELAVQMDGTDNCTAAVAKWTLDDDTVQVRSRSQ